MRKPTCAEGHHLVDIWLASLSHPVLSQYSPTRSVKQNSEACGGGLVRVHCLSVSWDKPNQCCNERKQKILILGVWPWPFSNPCLIQLFILLAFLPLTWKRVMSWFRNAALKYRTELDNIAKITYVLTYLLHAIPVGIKGSNDGPPLLSVLHGPAFSESSLHPVVVVLYVAVSVPKVPWWDCFVTAVPTPNPWTSGSLTFCLTSTLWPVRHGWPFQAPTGIALRVFEVHVNKPPGHNKVMILQGESQNYVLKNFTVKYCGAASSKCNFFCKQIWHGYLSFCWSSILGKGNSFLSIME